DQIDFTQQYPDVSMGRLASDPEQWVLYGIPTPEAANLNPPLEILEPSASVQSSLPSGYYSQPVHLILQAADASAIHFTTDGSTPGPLSPQYSSPLDFSQTTIVRA
ncbi:MAG: chitobiase/beta-hexosaminidase C-terminal domain-containing protein, partial [Limisphaerales bacterium]